MTEAGITTLNTFISKLQYKMGELGYKYLSNSRSYKYTSDLFSEIEEIGLLLNYFNSILIQEEDDNTVLQKVSFYTARYNLYALPYIEFPTINVLFSSTTTAVTGDTALWSTYTAVSNVNLGDYNISNVGSLQFSGGSGDQGTLSWNTEEETIDVIQNGSVLQLGLENHHHVRNNSGSQIDNGTVVMATGSLGASSRITVAPWDGTTNIKYILGITTYDIPNGEDGKVTWSGKVRGVDTGAIAGTFTDGVIYAKTDGTGGLTYDKPTSGQAIALAFLVSAETAPSANNGVIEVRALPFDENIFLGTTNNGILTYNSTTGQADVEENLTWASNILKLAGGSSGDATLYISSASTAPNSRFYLKADDGGWVDTKVYVTDASYYTDVIASLDTGSEPMFYYNARIGSAAVSNRPIATWLNNNSKIAELSAGGQLTLHNYSTGSYPTGTTAKWLTVDASGNVITEDAPIGFSVSGTTDNGLITYDNASGEGVVESNLTFNGTNLYVGSGTKSIIVGTTAASDIRLQANLGTPLAGVSTTTNALNSYIDDANTSLSIVGRLAAEGDDSGTLPIVEFGATRSGIAISTRPLFAWYNYTTKVTEISAAGDWDFQTNKLTNIADPTSAQDAATKNYVDNLTAESDWTLSVKDGAGVAYDGTIVSENGYYIKVGNQVTVTGTVTLNNDGTNITVYVHELPFTSKNISGLSYYGSGRLDGIINYTVIPRIDSNSSRLIFIRTATDAAITTNDFGTGGVLKFTITYFT